MSVTGRKRPRRRRRGSTGEPHREIVLYWAPLLHPCGDVVDWGAEPNRVAGLVALMRVLAMHPCPWHGSAMGFDARPIDDGITYLVANDVWYRAAGADDAIAGLRNRELALGGQRR